MTMETSAPRTARARVRAELTREILIVGRRHLAEVGAVGLSLRAVARDVGMVSSAIYRYFPSRDDLLTALILEAYESLADTATAADARCRRADLSGRWLAVCRSVRGWALANPHEYALVYGTPVPGYVAPQVTLEPVTRLANVVAAILRDASRSGRLVKSTAPMAKKVRRALDPLKKALTAELPDEAVAGALIGWTHLFGAVSFELFGHRHNVVEDYSVFFDFEMTQICQGFICRDVVPD